MAFSCKNPLLFLAIVTFLSFSHCRFPFYSFQIAWPSKTRWWLTQMVTIKKKKLAKTNYQKYSPRTLYPMSQRKHSSNSMTSASNTTSKSPVSPFIYSPKDAVKPAACFYTGFYLQKYLQSARGDSKQIDKYIGSFCEKSADVLPIRTEFVTEILDYNPDDKFGEKCQKYLSSKKDINSWFAPIDPMVSITPR